MSEDLSNVPRRLRRFYRKGEPIPTEMEEKNNSSPAVSKTKKESLEDEPWMNPPAPLPRRMQRKNQTRVTASSSSPTPIPPRGVFEKINEQNKAEEKPLDNPLGLKGKSAFEEKLPAGGEKAIQTVPPNANVQAALSKLKELAVKDTPTYSSFHFTPAGEAPAAAEPEKLEQKNNPPIPGNAYLSPRERMQMRKQRAGEPSPPTENQTESQSSKGNETESRGDDRPAHIRRRMGQRTDESGNEMGQEGGGEMNPSEKEFESEDFKSLFGDEKKKKAKKTMDEDDELGLGDDLPLLDDEK